MSGTGVLAVVVAVAYIASCASPLLAFRRAFRRRGKRIPRRVLAGALLPVVVNALVVIAGGLLGRLGDPSDRGTGALLGVIIGAIVAAIVLRTVVFGARRRRRAS